MFRLCLFYTLSAAIEKKDVNRQDALLEELHTLARIYPDDVAVRQWLARGLFNMLVEVNLEEDLGRRDVLLDELRALAKAYPDDVRVRYELAMSLYNTIVILELHEDLKHRQSLVEELRTLANSNPDDAMLRELLTEACRQVEHKRYSYDATRLLDSRAAIIQSTPQRVGYHHDTHLDITRRSKWQVQIVLERELLMTPAARAQMKAAGDGESLEDLLALAADVPESQKLAEPKKPAEPET